MLVKNENEWCWCLGEHIGYPQKSIEDAVKEFEEEYPNMDTQLIRVGNPYYYVPTVNADRVIEEIAEYDLDDEIVEYSDEYLFSVKQEHIDELQKSLTKVFREWEERNGYKNTSFVIFETINPFEDKE